MKIKKGQIQVSTENIFPIIRQWLYSNRDIFLRELVSNSADALSKLRQLANMGEIELDQEEFRIEIRFDTGTGKLMIVDNGIGMTEAELDKYINQIAYSGMTDFVTYYQEHGGAEDAGFIGHFGLGFYSAFMVAEKVEIDTLSWQEGATPVLWQSEEGIEYQMSPGTRSERGTTITLTLTPEDREWLTSAELRQIIDKYCRFMSWPIYYLTESDTEAELWNDINLITDKISDQEAVNIVEPLWLKPPAQISDQEYITFYKDTFNSIQEPLFWVHLNMDYPFRLKGILYFPQIKDHIQTLEGRILLFYNQVFVSDNTKEIIPEFLFLLQGMLDCPDLPLNVSRSFLQNDPSFKRLSQHIVRKVAERLNKLNTEEREYYESVWPKISLFVKYGILSDQKFYEYVKPSLLFATTKGKYLSEQELPADKVLYTPAADQLAVHVRIAEEQEIPVLIMDQEIDTPLMSFIEYHSQGKRQFVRADSDYSVEADNDLSHLMDLFPTATDFKISGFKLSPLGINAPPAILHEPEEMRRIREFSQQMALDAQMPADKKEELTKQQMELLLNEDSKLITSLLRMNELPERKESARRLASYIFDLTRLAQGLLSGEDLADFIDRSTRLAEQTLESQ
ncbi:MAG: molecular chaperone HtpG [Clostridiaceae bacterium]|nr:molecular chaperone HtpG [Clostridiaceae bacterium]